MKKILFAGFTGTFIASIITSTAYTQVLTSTAKLKIRPSVEKTTHSGRKLNTTKDSGAFFLNNINVKAVQHFAKTYKNPSDVRWDRLTNGFRVNFINDDIPTKIFYSKKGSPESSIRYYHEDKLPREIRHLVKSNYYDFNICLITEVNADHKTAYLVKMEDKTCWKTIKIVDGEMEITEEFSKN